MDIYWSVFFILCCASFADPKQKLLRQGLSCTKPHHTSKTSSKPVSIVLPNVSNSMDSVSSPSHSNAIPVVSTLSSLEIPSSSQEGSVPSIRKPISLWCGMFHSPVTKALWQARVKKSERLLVDTSMRDAPPQSELLSRTPLQSRTMILYNFSTDYTLRGQYCDPWNEIRIGKLLEDLDALAGIISFKHCHAFDTTTRPLLLVTASVDKILLKRPISVEIDLKIVGAVIWAAIIY